MLEIQESQKHIVFPLGLYRKEQQKINAKKFLFVTRPICSINRLREKQKFFFINFFSPSSFSFSSYLPREITGDQVVL